MHWWEGDNDLINRIVFEVWTRKMKGQGHNSIKYMKMHCDNSKSLLAFILKFGPCMHCGMSMI